MSLEISTASVEYVEVPVEAWISGVAYNPTVDPVSFAFLTTRTSPVTGDFKSGSWETDASVTPPLYWARCLVGPGTATVLAVGFYYVWVKVTDNPEVPVRRVDTLRVT